MDSKYFSVLEEMNSGRTLREIEDGLIEINSNIAENGGSGELTIKLKITATKRNLNEVTANVAVKLPKAKPEVSIFFYDEHNNLVRDDPRQAKLPLGHIEVVGRGKGAAEDKQAKSA